MDMSVELDLEVEQRLDRLVRDAGRSKEFFLQQMILQGLEDVEDAYLGAAVAERISRGEQATRPLEVVVAELGLDD